jgi:hypothetical protein
MDQRANFYLFGDANELEVDDPSEAEWNAVRGKGKLVAAIDMDGQKAMFEERIARLLTRGNFGQLVHACETLQLIRNGLIRGGKWTEDGVTHLCRQLFGEWGGFVVPPAFYEVEQSVLLWESQRRVEEVVVPGLL